MAQGKQSRTGGRRPAQLRAGNRIIIDSHEATVLGVVGPDDEGRWTITTDRGEYRRTGGIKIEVLR